MAKEDSTKKDLDRREFLKSSGKATLSLGGLVVIGSGMSLAVSCGTEDDESQPGDYTF
jgi:hypothetical protein